MTTAIGNHSLGISPAIMKQLNQLTSQGIQGNNPDVLGAATGKPASNVDFKDLIMQSINQVNDMQQNADVAIETLMTGGEINPAQVMTAIQKADMSFRMMQQIRNKLMDAYREIKDIRI